MNAYYVFGILVFPGKLKFNDKCGSFLNNQKKQNFAQANEIFLSILFTLTLIAHILILSKTFPHSYKELL